MKVAIMIDSLAIGGAQKHVRQLACALASHGVAVTVYVLNGIVSEVYLNPMLEAGVRIHVVGRKRVICGIGLGEVVADMWRSRIDVLLTFLFVSTICGRVAALAEPRVREVTCLQARNLDYKVWQKALLRLTARLSFWTFSNSMAAIAWAEVHEGVNRRRSTFIANVAETQQVAIKEASWSELGYPWLEGRQVVGAIGRLVPQKGFDILIRAFRNVSEKVPKAALLIVGEGPSRKELEESASERSGSVVVFAGQRSDIELLLRKITLYVQPSRFEGTPNALMEAMAAACPVIATAVDGASEIVSHHEDGILVPPENAEALSRAILDLLADHALARSLGYAAQTKMRTYSNSFPTLLVKLRSIASESSPV